LLPPTQIETPRLLLRQPIFPDDAPRVFASYAHDTRVTRYLTWRPHRDLEETRRILRTRLSWWEEGREYSWVITDRTHGTVLGMISVTPDDTAWRYSLGYVLAHEYWGRGYMTEAARSVIDTLLTLPPICRVWAVVDVENAASARVLEKAGMEREGLLHRWSVHPAISPAPRDCWCFAKVR
jgi:RimJ/RimL family protein N-acetyltransferase